MPLTTAQLNTLNASTLGTLTIAQIKQVGDVLARMPTLAETKTIANVVTTLGTANP